VATGVLASRLTLLGPGRAGRALARSWLSAGGQNPDIVARDSAAARDAVASIGGGRPLALSEAVDEADILVIAVPDDEIARAVRLLDNRIRPRTAFHLSGALPAAILEPLRPSSGSLAGPPASLGSLHPLRAFTGAPDENWQDAFVAIEGDDAAVGVAEALVSALGGRSRRLSPEAKPLYHAAAALAAGGTVALLSLAAQAWEEAGIPLEEARPALAALARQAAAGAAAQDFERALTGPVARRDSGTLRVHLAALSSRPGLREIYVLLASEILRRTPGIGRENEILELLTGSRGW
jgi:predicted short-subunit dehydrogenase-like oxidoreductase (DUF2520 family)